MSTYHDILYRFHLGFWLFWRGVGEILGFDDSKRVKTQTFLFMDGLDWFFNSISLRGCRCEISGQITPARPAVKFWTSKHLVWVKRGSGRASRVTATRVGQHNNINSATERIDSTDRRGAVEQGSTTERMTDTTMRTRARNRAQPWLRMQPLKVKRKPRLTEKPPSKVP